mgnify:CR=1 FL=1
MYIEQQSVLVEVLIESPSFFGVKADIPKAVGDRILQLQKDLYEVQKYLGVIKSGTHNEVPSCLEIKEELVPPVAAKGPPRKRKATAATLNSKSQKSSSKTEQPSSTSPQAAK